MRIETIVTHVNRMIKNYSPEAAVKVIEAKINLVRDELAENYSDRQFIEAIDEILHDENVKRFPTIAQIRNFMRKGKIHTQEGAATHYCTQCEKSGYYNVWQYMQGLGKYYSLAYRCKCNHSQQLHLPIIDDKAIPVRAHNPYPPNDHRHEDFNGRGMEIEY